MVGLHDLVGGAFGTDFDGGVSALGPGHGDPNGRDPHFTSPTGTTESVPTSFACGRGGELVPALGLILFRRRRYGLRNAARS
jgi:hypothetical protein